MKSAVLLAVLALAIPTFAKDARQWRECSIKYGEQYTKQTANENTVMVNPGLRSILLDKLARDKKAWFYVIDAGAQFYAVESKASLDIDIDQATKYARKGDRIYILDRSGKEKALRLVKQMSRAEAEEMARQK